MLDTKEFAVVTEAQCWHHTA